MTTPHDIRPVLRVVREHPEAVTGVVIRADDVVNHWRRRYDAPTLSNIAEHMARMATLLERLALAIDDLRAAERTTRTVAEAAQVERARRAQVERAQVERDDDSVEFAVEQDLGKLKLP